MTPRITAHAAERGTERFGLDEAGMARVAADIASGRSLLLSRRKSQEKRLVELPDGRRVVAVWCTATGTVITVQPNGDLSKATLARKPRRRGRGYRGDRHGKRMLAECE